MSVFVSIFSCSLFLVSFSFFFFSFFFFFFFFFFLFLFLILFCLFCGYCFFYSPPYPFFFFFIIIIFFPSLSNSIPPPPQTKEFSKTQRKMSIGVPVKLIHEAENHVITIELKSGELYRGTLQTAEDNMNCHLTNKGTDLIYTDRFSFFSFFFSFSFRFFPPPPLPPPTPSSLSQLSPFLSLLQRKKKNPLKKKLLSFSFSHNNLAPHHHLSIPLSLFPLFLPSLPPFYLFPFLFLSFPPQLNCCFY